MYKLIKKYPLQLILVFILLPGVVFTQPVISGFNPLSGHVGDTVIINGSNFSAMPSGNIVRLGSIKATVLSAESNRLTITIPSGAVYAPFTVTTAGLTAYAAKSFTVTFPAGAGAFVPGSFAPVINFGDLIVDASLVLPSDINGDGKADLVFMSSSNREPTSMAVRQNTSTRGIISFAEKTTFTALQNYLGGFAVDDLNGDGKPDIAMIAIENNVMLVLKNTSTVQKISFAEALSFEGSGGESRGVAIGDLDNDGKPEVVVANYRADSVAVFKNKSSVTTIDFEPAVKFAVSDMQGAPYEIRINDLDGDGFADIAVTNRGGNTICMLRNSGLKNRIAFEKRIEYVLKSPLNNLTLGDFDSDGKMDMAATLTEADIVAIFKNNSSPGKINFSNVANLPDKFSPVGITACDFDGDGRTDLAAAIGNSNAISLLRNESTVNSISFAPPENFNVIRGNPWRATAADFDNDGKADLVSGTYYSSSGSASIAVLRNKTNEPVITSFSPDTAYAGFEITIRGSHFRAISSVTIGGNPARSFQVKSDSVITAVTGNTGSGNIVVNSLYGSDSVPGFTFIPPPKIYFASPMSAGSGNLLIVYGANFYGVRSISFGDVPASYSYVNSAGSELYAAVDTGSSGFIKITTATGSDSLAGFRFIPKPVLNSFTPNSGGTGTEITIRGRYLADAVTVTFGGLNAASFTIISDSVIKATVGGIASGDVVVSSPGGADTLKGFTHKGPVIRTYSSENNCISPGGQVIIKGRNFAAADTVQIGGHNVLFRIIADSAIEANVDSISIPYIRIISKWGKAIYTMPAPVISSFTPTSGEEGTLVTIKGKYFCNIKTVTFSGTPANAFTVVSDSVITATVGSGSGGAIYVTSVAGGTSSYWFNYTGPYVSYAIPSKATMGDTVKMYGGNLQGATSVQFGGVNASWFSVENGSSIRAVVPNGASGNILVITPAGMARLSGFIYNAAIRTVLCPPVSGAAMRCNIGAADYQWQMADSAGVFSNISDNAFFSNTTSFNLQLNNIPSSWYGKRFRCLADGRISDIFEIRFENTWTNTVSDSWENKLNWSCGYLPDNNTDVIIGHGKAIINSKVSIHSITIKPSAAVTIKKDKELSVSH